MKKLLMLILIVFVAMGCKKENRIERNLWKKGGEWNIERWSETATSTHYPEDNYSETKNNPGTFKFNKDGSGSLTLKDGSSAYTEAITYQNTENTLTIFDSEGEGKVFDLSWEKNDMTLTSNDSETYTTYDPDSEEEVTVYFTHNLVIECKKK